MQQDGVERVLHLVGDAAGNAADGRQAVGGLEFAVDLALRFGVAQPDQNSAAGAAARPAGSPVCPRTAARRRGPTASDRPRPPEPAGCESARPVCEACATSSPRVAAGGNRLDIDWPGQLGAVAAEKFLDRPGGEDQAEFAIENKDGVLQVLQQVVDVAAQIARLRIARRADAAPAD